MRLAYALTATDKRMCENDVTLGIPKTYKRMTVSTQMWYQNKLWHLNYTERPIIIATSSYKVNIEAFKLHKGQRSALNKLLGHLGIYATWLSTIAYLQKQLRIFIFFLRHVFLLCLHVFLLHETIEKVLSYLFTPIVALSKVSN